MAVSRMSIQSLEMEVGSKGIISSLDGSSAIFGGASNCYRYELRRTWDLRMPPLVVCMLNPSTADHQADDPTIMALIHYARAWGYGGLIVVNLFAFRASSPTMMMSTPHPIGSENQMHVEAALRTAKAAGRSVLAAWGNDGNFQDRDRWFCSLAKTLGVQLVCLGTTLSGAPKHPMARGRHRIPRDQKPLLWRTA